MFYQRNLTFLFCIMYCLYDSGITDSQFKRVNYNIRLKSAEINDGTTSHFCGAANLKVERTNAKDAEIEFSWKGLEGVAYEILCHVAKSYFYQDTQFECSTSETQDLVNYTYTWSYILSGKEYFCAVKMEKGSKQISNIIRLQTPDDPIPRDLMISLSCVALVLFVIVLTGCLCRYKKKKPSVDIVWRQSGPLTIASVGGNCVCPVVNESSQQPFPCRDTGNGDNPPPYPFEEQHQLTAQPLNRPNHNYKPPFKDSWENPPPYSAVRNS